MPLADVLVTNVSPQSSTARLPLIPPTSPQIVNDHINQDVLPQIQTHTHIPSFFTTPSPPLPLPPPPSLSHSNPMPFEDKSAITLRVEQEKNEEGIESDGKDKIVTRTKRSAISMEMNDFFEDWSEPDRSMESRSPLPAQQSLLDQLRGVVLDPTHPNLRQPKYNPSIPFESLLPFPSPGPLFLSSFGQKSRHYFPTSHPQFIVEPSIFANACIPHDALTHSPFTHSPSLLFPALIPSHSPVGPTSSSPPLFPYLSPQLSSLSLSTSLSSICLTDQIASRVSDIHSPRPPHPSSPLSISSNSSTSSQASTSSTSPLFSSPHSPAPHSPPGCTPPNHPQSHFIPHVGL